MSIYDILFDMNAVPKKNPDVVPSRDAARFISYMNRSIELSAKKYIREYNRFQKNEYSAELNAADEFEIANSDAAEMTERIETMVMVMNEIAQLKKGEQKVYICLYQLDWNVSKTAHFMGCSESYVCRLNREVIRKLGLALKDSE